MVKFKFDNSFLFFKQQQNKGIIQGNFLGTRK